MNTILAATKSQSLGDIEQKMIEAFKLCPLTHYQCEVFNESPGSKITNFLKFSTNAQCEIVEAKVSFPFGSTIYFTGIGEITDDQGRVVERHYDLVEKSTSEKLIDATLSGDFDKVLKCIELEEDINQSSSEGGTALFYAASANNLPIIKILIEHGARIDAKDITGFTPTQRAAAKGGYEVMKFLIERGADIQTRDKEGATILHSAAVSGNAEAVHYLLSKGCNVNDQQNSGKISPLHSAVIKGHLSVVSELIAGSANVNVVEEVGATPLHAAVYLGYEEVAAALLKAGANKDLSDKNGNRPIDLARQTGKKNIESMLY